MENSIQTEINQWLTGETNDSFESIVRRYDLVTVVSTLFEDYPAQHNKIVDKILEHPVTNSSPIKTIAIHCDSLANGGIQRVVAQLLQILTPALPYRFILISDAPASSADYPIPDSIARYVLGGGSCTKEKLTLLYEILQKEKVDVFWDHIFYNQDILGYILLCRGLSIRLLQHHHNIFSNFIARNSLQTEALFNAYKLCDLILVLSPATQTFFNLLNYPASYVPNPPSFQISHDSQYNPNTQNILWIARIDKIKQPLDAIHIFALVHEKYPNATITIVGGEGDVELEKEMNDLISDLHLENNVIRPGFQANVQQYYKQSSLMLMTSQYEGFPMTLTESKSCGIPVLLYDMPYLALAGEHDGTIRVRQGDICGAGKAICDFLSSGERRLQLSQEAVASYHDYMSFDFVSFYRSLFENMENGILDKKEEINIKTFQIILQTFLFHTYLGNRLQQKKFQDIKDQCAFYEMKYTSPEYRTGKYILLIPRKIIGLFICIKENGWRYTLNHITKIFKNKFK